MSVKSSLPGCPRLTRIRPVANGVLMQKRHNIQEILVKNSVRPLLRADVLLLSAGLLLQLGVANAAPGPAGPAGHAGDKKPPPALKADSRPDAFSFATKTKVPADTLVESDAVTISGINVPAPIAISGGEYSINGGAYRKGPGTIQDQESVRVRVRSSREPSGVVSAKLTVGGVSGSFTVKTVNSTGRVEAEAATLTGHATQAPDPVASKGKAVFVGRPGAGISIADSLDAKALILSYKTDATGSLQVKVNGSPVGEFTIRPTAGAYATSSVFASVHEGDVIAIQNPTTAGPASTRIDYLEFAASPFKTVSTVATTDAWAMDGLSIGPDGAVYVSGGHRMLRVTPAGAVTVLATGLGSGNDSGFDSHGNLFFADYNGSAVRKITPAGVMTTVASALDGPAGLWVDQDDNLLVTLYGANFSGTGATVLKIAPDGAISTYASGAPLQDLIGITGDENGQVYVANYSGGKIFNITGGNVSLLAETGVGANMLCYSHGGIYSPSPDDDQIRRIDLDGTVEHFAGSSVRQTIDGPIASAAFMRPSACDFTDGGTVMYVLDWETGVIRRIDAGKP
jgi:hypothetical protein